MAKSIRSKVKKRLRTVKRGVVKAELLNPTSKLGVREVQKGEKMREALSGYLKPGVCRTAPPVWPTRPAPHSRCSPHDSPPPPPPTQSSRRETRFALTTLRRRSLSTTGSRAPTSVRAGWRTRATHAWARTAPRSAGSAAMRRQPGRCVPRTTTRTCGQRIALSRCRSRRGSARRARAPATRPALVGDPGSWDGNGRRMAG
jgi:hypothetical protein